MLSFQPQQVSPFFSKVSVLVTNEKALMKSMIEMNENCDVQTKRKIEKLGKFIL